MKKPLTPKTAYSSHPVVFSLYFMAVVIILLSVLAAVVSASFLPFFLGFSLAMILICFAVVIDYLAEIAFYLGKK